MIGRRWRDMGGDRGALELGLGPGWGAMGLPILGVVLVLIANVAVGTLWTWPRWRDMAASGAVARQEQQAQAILAPALEEARESHGRVVRAQADLRELRERVMGRSGSVADVVSTLRAVVDAAGVEAGRIDYQAEPVEELGLTQLQVSLPVRGDYASVRGLLDRLRDAPVFLVVEEIGVATPRPGQSLLQIQLVASAFTGAEIAREPGDPPTPFVPISETEAVDAAVAGEDPAALARRLRSRLAALPDIPLSAAELELHLQRLDAEVDDARESTRNLFDFAGAVIAERQRRQREQAEAREERVPEPAEPEAPFELRGIVRADELWATLVDEDERVHVVTAGNRLPGNYLVVEVGAVHVFLERRGERFRLSLRREGLEEHAWAPPSRIESRDESRRKKKRDKSQRKGTSP